MLTTAEIITKAYKQKKPVPAFNLPYLPMVEPILQALVDQDAFALVETARVEWRHCGAGGPDAVMAEYAKHSRLEFSRLHLDHIRPQDDYAEGEYLTIIRQAIDLGFQSVMIDASGFSLDQNIAITRQVAGIAHAAGIACEAELGGIFSLDDELPPYEEFFVSRKGFTQVDEAARFVNETGCDWLSVAIGSFHGALSEAFRSRVKPTAHLALDLLAELADATGIPLVLHGGSGVEREDMRAAVGLGITKINVGADNRQAYEAALNQTGSAIAAQQAVYDRTCQLLSEYFCISGLRADLIEA